jgi:lipopolysaccharide export system protein LptC
LHRPGFGSTPLLVPLPRLGLIAGLVACALGCDTPKGGVEDPTPPPQVTLYGVRLSSFKGETLSVAGRAAKVTYHRASADLAATETLLRFPVGAHKRSTPTAGMEIRAPTVLGNLSTKQAVWKDGVVMRSPSGLTAQTPKAHFDGIKVEAYGNDRIAAQGPGYAVRANGFHLFFSEERFEFKEGVHSLLGGK